MQGVDAILDFNFPNPLGVMSNQLVANGVNVPHVDGASAGIQAAAGRSRAQQRRTSRASTTACRSDQSDKRSKKFVADYKAKFGGATPVYSAAQTYDMLNFAADIAAKQGARHAEGDAQGSRHAGVDRYLRHVQVGRHPGAVAHGRPREVRRQRRREHREDSSPSRPASCPFTVVTTIPTTTVAPDHHDQGSVIQGLRDNQALASDRREQLHGAARERPGRRRHRGARRGRVPPHLQGHRGRQLRPGLAHHARGLHRDLA